MNKIKVDIEKTPTRPLRRKLSQTDLLNRRQGGEPKSASDPFTDKNLRLNKMVHSIINEDDQEYTNQKATPDKLRYQELQVQVLE